jgi:hypothetical protein
MEDIRMLCRLAVGCCMVIGASTTALSPAVLRAAPILSEEDGSAPGVSGESTAQTLIRRQETPGARPFASAGEQNPAGDTVNDGGILAVAASTIAADAVMRALPRLPSWDRAGASEREDPFGWFDLGGFILPRIREQLRAAAVTFLPDYVPMSFRHHPALEIGHAAGPILAPGGDAGMPAATTVAARDQVPEEVPRWVSFVVDLEQFIKSKAALAIMVLFVIGYVGVEGARKLMKVLYDH